MSGAFWGDVSEDAQDPEFARAYESESRRVHTIDPLEQGVALSSQLIRAIGRNNNDVAAALTEMFAWTAEFTQAELAAYANEVEQLVYVASKLGEFEGLLQAQRSWQETALAYAAGLRTAEVIEWLDVPVRVERP
jgi:hypothetical protein